MRPSLFLLLLTYSSWLSGQEPVKEVQPQSGSSNKLQLEATIRGSREQPTVISIVPWQQPEQKGQLPSPAIQQINQRLKPIDRREFLRELAHYEKLSNR